MQMTCFNRPTAVVHLLVHLFQSTLSFLNFNSLILKVCLKRMFIVSLPFIITRGSEMVKSKKEPELTSVLLPSCVALDKFTWVLRDSVLLSQNRHNFYPLNRDVTNINIKRYNECKSISKVLWCVLLLLINIPGI